MVLKNATNIKPASGRGVPMKLKSAQEIAERFVHQIANYCERIEIAGSLRRKQESVKYIELVAIPKIEYSPDLFGNPSLPFNLLSDFLRRKKGTPFELIKNGDRYKQLVMAEGISVDLFIVLPPAQWGVMYAIHTGPRNFSQWLITKKKYGGAMPSYMRVRKGSLWTRKSVIDTPEEKDYFETIGLAWTEPEHRVRPKQGWIS